MRCFTLLFVVGYICLGDCEGFANLQGLYRDHNGNKIDNPFEAEIAQKAAFLNGGEPSAKLFWELFNKNGGTNSVGTTGTSTSWIGNLQNKFPFLASLFPTVARMEMGVPATSYGPPAYQPAFYQPATSYGPPSYQPSVYILPAYQPSGYQPPPTYHVPSFRPNQADHHVGADVSDDTIAVTAPGFGDDNQNRGYTYNNPNIKFQLPGVQRDGIRLK